MASSQSPFQLKTVRSIFSFANNSSQQTSTQGSQDPIGGDSGGAFSFRNPSSVVKKVNKVNLALSQVTLGSPVEGLAANTTSNLHGVSCSRDENVNVFDSHLTQVSQSQDFFCTPDFITPSDAQVKLPAPGFNASAAPNSNPPTREFTPLGVKRPRSVFDVLMCPENRRSVQAYTQELNAYKPPGTKIRGGIKNIKAILKSPTCVKNPFRDSLTNIPKNVKQENLLSNTDDEGAGADSGKMDTDAFDEPQLGKRSKKSTDGETTKKRRQKKKMHLSINGMNNGRYRCDFKEVQRLGHGSFSTVYRCIHRLDGTQYAVKHVKKNLTASNAEIAQALQEVQAYSALGPHANVLNYHTCWIENSRLYIQLELSDCCLTDLSKQGKSFDEEELTWMLWSILQALHHMHSHSLAHMDVKPDNIHIVNNKYKIGDLGTCTRYADLENKENHEGVDGPSTASACLYREGDARYMAPELLNDDLAQLDKSDIWALGATAYELARKCPLPMKGDSYRDIREDVLSSLPEEFSPGFLDLIKTMMRSNPQERPSAVELMQCKFFDNVRNNT